MKMSNENYITIQGWMRTELDLKGSELIVYALIYGFCQTDGQKFTGSLQYIADWCGYTKQGVLKTLKVLQDKNLIIKETDQINGLAYTSYRLTKFNGIKQELPTIKQSLTNNNTLYNNQDISNQESNNKALQEPDFKFGAQKSVRPTLYDNCRNMIYEFSKDPEIIKALSDYLKLRLEMKDKPFYANQWKGMLKKLKEIHSKDSDTSILDIINQSIEKGYASFYEVKQYKYTSYNIKSQPHEQEVVCSQYTEEELKRQEEWRAEMRKQGKKVDF